jgi:phosphatidylserine/phosphatidylglycerophosphate/cardiolipin synthase-like enzyme
MPERAKRFYVCNLIPLWEVDEGNLDVDWPLYHVYFNDLIEMKADVKERQIRWTTGDGKTIDPDLKIRFEVYESDFLLSGGLNDSMGVFSSHSNFGDDPTVRPIKIVEDFDRVSESDREKFIFISWIEGHETTVTVTAPDSSTSSHTERVPITLQVRCWWRVKEEEGGDVSGNPEYYYDFFLEGKLQDGSSVSLRERSDHELEGFHWHVTKNVNKGRVTPIVDGEYAFIKMLQLMDEAQNSIHILNWKLDPQATLLVEPEFQGDYLQVPGLDKPAYDALLVRQKPLTNKVAAKNGVIFYTASNGNVMVATADGASIVPAVQHRDDPTNLDWPVGVHILEISSTAIQALVLDQWRSRLLLFIVVPLSGLAEVAPGVFLARFPVGSTVRTYPFFRIKPTIPNVMANPALAAGFIPLAGDGNPGYKDGGMQPAGRGSPLLIPSCKLNHPSEVLVADKTVFISDTGNHCIRKMAGFDPADLISAFTTTSFNLTTLAGKPTPGNSDGSGDAARFNSPTGLAWDSIKSRLYVADTGNQKIRVVNINTGAVTTLAITKIDGSAGELGKVMGLAFNPGQGSEGTLYIAEKERHRILAVDIKTLQATTLAGAPTGKAGYQDGPAASALFNSPTGLAFDNDLVFVADSENRVIRVIETGSNTVRTIGSKTVPGVQDVPVVLADVLQRKAKAGVKVRILLDEYGSGISRDEIGGRPLVYITGGQTEADLRFLHEGIEAFVQKHEQTFGSRTLGSNHEKMIVVDGKVGITGGIDFAPDKNDGLIHNRKHRTSIFWHDVVALVEGKSAHGLEQHFVRRWRMAREGNILLTFDRTDLSIQDFEVESVRTYDPSPIIEFAVGRESSAVREIMESYRRAILSARYYVYMEHQYIYYPEIGEFLEQAMKENRQLQVIWLIPFFTEESSDPVGERARLKQANALASAITDTGALAKPEAGGTAHQIRSQISWHGFFRQHEMVQKFRAIDANRFGVFSTQRLFSQSADLSDLRMEMIYPHSKMILCDDRFFSIGSANANGRGFTKDGEHNISVLSPVTGKALRERLWGEHLGYQGLAMTLADGRLLPIAGHHLEPNRKLQLQHPTLGNVEREVDEVDGPSGAIKLKGAPLDPTLGRVLWKDPLFAELPIRSCLRVWRESAHSLATLRKLKGTKARTDTTGRLVVPGNLVEVGDLISFGQRIVVLNEEGSASSSEPILQPYVAGMLKVKSKVGDVIELETQVSTVPDVEWIAAMAVGDEKFNDQTRPFVIKLKSRASGVAGLEIRLAPKLDNVPFDYVASWLKRQPGGKRGVRAWEIDPPEGIEYAGPGSTLFSPWLLLPWLFVDFDIDEQARLDMPAGDTRIV